MFPSRILIEACRVPTGNPQETVPTNKWTKKKKAKCCLTEKWKMLLGTDLSFIVWTLHRGEQLSPLCLVDPDKLAGFKSPSAPMCSCIISFEPLISAFPPLLRFKPRGGFWSVMCGFTCSDQPQISGLDHSGLIHSPVQSEQLKNGHQELVNHSGGGISLSPCSWLVFVRFAKFRHQKKKLLQVFVI